MTVPVVPGLAWWAAKDDNIAHGFPDSNWMRSLCGDLRWNASLEPPAWRRPCPGCEVLLAGVVVTRVQPRRTDPDAKRVAIARANARRRWRRTT